MTETAPKPKSKKPKKQKHIPVRTCIACKQSKPKRELIRVVRTPEGHVEIDTVGKKSGRGAYLCATKACWDTALDQKKFQHEFEVAISEEDWQDLDEFRQDLPVPVVDSKQTIKQK